jgi:predicted HicB family RNase H-like nuclease
MGKANSLKDSMKGGLNGLLSSTAPSVKESKATQPKPKTEPEAQKKREPAVHCNFVIDKSIHTRMKYLAIDKNMSLRDIVNQAMQEYLDRNER